MHSTQALCAKAVRQELKAAFPETKFRITSEGFAGGNAVNVYWTDGPTSKQVDAITDKYQQGHFNGMEDLYEYSNDRSDIPQVKYLSTHREVSEAWRAIVQAELVSSYGMKEWSDDEARRVSGQWSDTFLYRNLVDRIFPNFKTV